MDVIDRDTVLRIVDEKGGWPSVSLYLPVHRVPMKTAPDRIALRDLITAGFDELTRSGMREVDAMGLLAEASDMAGPDGPWDGGFEGLAVFASSWGTSMLRLDDPVPTRVIVADAPYVRPLLPSMHGGRCFWALALDKNAVRLYHATDSGFDEVDLGEATPTSMAEELRYDEREEQLQLQTVHVASGTEAGRGIAAFHGHGGEKDRKAADLARFAGDVENGVTHAIGADVGEPLVLMGVDYVLEAYRQANTYPRLSDEQITGSVGHLSKSQIRALAASALESVWRVELDRDLAQLQEKDGTGLASRDIDEILVAAAEGRVATMFADDGMGPWGVFDHTEMRVREVCPAEPEMLRRETPPADARGSCGWDLVDLAAVETLRHRGSVHGFTGEGAAVSGAAAIFRY